MKDNNIIKTCEMKIRNSSFFNNTSLRGRGGAIYYDNKRPILLTNNLYVSNNATIGGNNFASFPVKLVSDQ